jgi:hypothetical protein
VRRAPLTAEPTRAAIGLAFAALACGGRSAPTGARALDAFDDVTAWTAAGSEGVTARVTSVPGVRGNAMQLDLDLGGTSGYAFARRPLALELPADFELTFELRGDVPINNLELKLVDASGENVWWYRRGNYEFPTSWRRVSVKRRQIEFAWGPTKDRTLRRIAAIELVVSAGTGGGKGTIAIDELVLRPRTPVPDPPPAPVTTRSPAGVVVDLGVERDLAGVLVHRPAAAGAYTVELSLDGERWQRAAEIAGAGGLEPVPLTDASARYVRIARAGEGGALGDVEITPIDAAAAPTPSAFVAAVARAVPRGAFPRAYVGEQPYWTVVGDLAGGKTALLSEDGAVELYPGGPSVEPFVVGAGGAVTSWADATAVAHDLADGYLPIPSVTWTLPGWTLEVTALAREASADDAAGASGPAADALAVRYTIVNTSSSSARPTLVLAVRPLQVNPPTQFLSIPGGVAPIERIAWTDGAIAIDGVPALRPLVAPARVPSPRPDGAVVVDGPLVGAWPFAAVGFPTAALPSAPAPASIEVVDPAGLASAALAFPLELAPGASASVVVAAPLGGALPGPVADAGAWFTAELAAARQAWHGALDRVELRVPDAGRPVVDTLRASLATMLVARDGVVLRPGTRSYARAWIRDGAMISEALLRLGHADAATAFLRWYAPYQFPSGHVPCCVEAAGAVPVPEHDSHGELIYLAALVYRYTRDRDELAWAWPYARAAANAIDELRGSERTAANQTPATRARYGLMPPSISHEGYSAKPAYSYWDDFWSVAGLADAAWLAGELGHADDAARFARSRDELRADVLASIAASAADHGVDYIPGAADLGDFDATSTTIGLAPAGLGRALPPALLAATFERAWSQLAARTPGATGWNDYTPYELRLVGSFVRLGWRERAMAALERYLLDRRPAGWKQWAEVVGREPRAPRFIGDMPHAWVASDYARSALDLFAYHRPDDDALVLAAGIPPAWFAGTGFAVGGLATPFGALAYAASTRGDVTTIELGPGQVPPGGLAIPWPFAGAPGRATIDGVATAWSDAGAAAPELVVRRRPAVIRLSRPGSPP